MEDQRFLLFGAGAAIWLFVFVAIVWRATFDSQYRRVVLRLTLPKIFLIGILWPLLAVGIPFLVVFHAEVHRIYQYLTSPRE